MTFSIVKNWFVSKACKLHVKIFRCSRNAEVTADAAVGLNLFSLRSGRGYPSLYLVTLSMNGRLRLWNCTNMSTFQEWNVLSDIIVDKEFATADALSE